MSEQVIADEHGIDPTGAASIPAQVPEPTALRTLTVSEPKHEDLEHR